jgi:hypothetical protein
MSPSAGRELRCDLDGVSSLAVVSTAPDERNTAGTWAATYIGPTLDIYSGWSCIPFQS